MSNMYPWVFRTHNPLAGECQHWCLYCFVQDLIKRNKLNRAKYTGPARLARSWDSFPKTDKNNPDKLPIFMCSCNDLFGKWVPEPIIRQILEKCCQYPDLTYLFQTKNTIRMCEYSKYLPPKCILGTTLESTYSMGKYSAAPRPSDRVRGLLSIGLTTLTQEKMVSIEPIIRIPEIGKMITWIRAIGPKFVSIGADSKGHGLPEPTPSEIQELIHGLEGFTEVKLKSNIRRLIDGQT